MSPEWRCLSDLEVGGGGFCARRPGSATDLGQRNAVGRVGLWPVAPSLEVDVVDLATCLLDLLPWDV